jgi:carbamoyl-phosphate synthase large subunit
MTDLGTADHVYLKPLEKKYIEEILKEHAIDAVLPTMGGQKKMKKRQLTLPTCREK